MERLLPHAVFARRRFHQILRICIVAALAWSCHASAALLSYKWVQTACVGPVCSANIEGTWTFEQAAVQRGTATFVSQPSAFPQIDPNEVQSFTFTIGAFVDQGISFGPLTWTNQNAVVRQGGLVGTYQVTFSADRKHITALSQSDLQGVFNDATSVTFERAPTNPTISIRVKPDSIFFNENTGSEPLVGDVPVTPSATLTGQWSLVSALPIPEPRPVDILAFALGLTIAVRTLRRAADRVSRRSM